MSAPEYKRKARVKMTDQEPGSEGRPPRQESGALTPVTCSVVFPL